jgi:D-alanyl-D-alanine carboxypeptidase/D-alanyl-D-alanine-endopeptidase (penicillin-binding protein 4)
MSMSPARSPHAPSPMLPRFTILRFSARLAASLVVVLGLALALPVAAEEEGAAPVAPLAALLDPLLDDALLVRAPAAVHVVNARTGEELYARDADRILLPASTMKVVTTAAALRTLGPAYTFDTEILHTGTLRDDGVLEGDLYVRGGGDPTLVLERLWKLVWELHLEGVRKIEGDVVFDDDLFDFDAGIPGWDKALDKANGPSYFPPLGALSLNYNTVAIYVAPGEEPGAPARLELETPSGVIELVNEVTTGSAHGRHWLEIERELEGVKTRFTLRGVVPAESGARRYYRSVGDPTAYFTGAFASLCKQQGIKVGGHYIDGSTPEDATLLLRQSSPSLGVILQTVDKHSNNFMAEIVLKAMGAAAHGAPGTTEKGLEVVRGYLEELGLDLEGTALVNGSGLTREGGVRPELLTAVLLDMHEDREVGAEFRAALAIGGLDGTLRSRFAEEEQVGRVRGKTGSLNGVHCLTGYVDGADGEVYAFAFLVNDIRGPLSRARRLHDRFVEVLLEIGGEFDLAAVVEDGQEDTGE